MDQNLQTATRYVLVKYPNGSRVPAYFKGFMFGMPCFGGSSQALTFTSAQQAIAYMNTMPKSLTLQLLEL